MATSNPKLTSTNLLTELDQATQQVIGADLEQSTCVRSDCLWRSTPSRYVARADVCGATAEAILAGQSASAGGAAGRVLIDSGSDKELRLDLSRPVPLPELRRHKRSFMKLTTQHDAAKLQGAAAAKRLFVDYLMEHIN